MARLTRTKAALAAYDELYADFIDAVGELNNAETNRRFDLVMAAERRVREAFADDTADVNQRRNALLINPDGEWLRRMIQKHG